MGLGVFPTHEKLRRVRILNSCDAFTSEAATAACAASPSGREVNGNRQPALSRLKSEFKSGESEIGASSANRSKDHKGLLLLGSNIKPRQCQPTFHLDPYVLTPASTSRNSRCASTSSRTRLRLVADQLEALQYRTEVKH